MKWSRTYEYIVTNWFIFVTYKIDISFLSTQYLWIRSSENCIYEWMDRSLVTLMKI